MIVFKVLILGLLFVKTLCASCDCNDLIQRWLPMCRCPRRSKRDLTSYPVPVFAPPYSLFYQYYGQPEYYEQSKNVRREIHEEQPDDSNFESFMDVGFYSDPEARTAEEETKLKVLRQIKETEFNLMECMKLYLELTNQIVETTKTSSSNAIDDIKRKIKQQCTHTEHLLKESTDEIVKSLPKRKRLKHTYPQGLSESKRLDLSLSSSTTQRNIRTDLKESNHQETLFTTSEEKSDLELNPNTHRLFKPFSSKTDKSVSLENNRPPEIEISKSENHAESENKLTTLQQPESPQLVDSKYVDSLNKKTGRETDDDLKKVLNLFENNDEDGFFTTTNASFLDEVFQLEEKMLKRKSDRKEDLSRSNSDMKNIPDRDASSNNPQTHKNNNDELIKTSVLSNKNHTKSLQSHNFLKNFEYRSGGDSTSTEKTISSKVDLLPELKPSTIKIEHSKRQRVTEKDIRIPKIVTTEKPNGKTTTEIVGTEVLPNKDFIPKATKPIQEDSRKTETEQIITSTTVATLPVKEISTNQLTENKSILSKNLDSIKTTPTAYTVLEQNSSTKNKNDFDGTHLTPSLDEITRTIDSQRTATQWTNTENDDQTEAVTNLIENMLEGKARITIEDNLITDLAHSTERVQFTSQPTSEEKDTASEDMSTNSSSETTKSVDSEQREPSLPDERRETGQAVTYHVSRTTEKNSDCDDDSARRSATTDSQSSFSSQISTEDSFESSNRDSQLHEKVSTLTTGTDFALSPSTSAISRKHNIPLKVTLERRTTLDGFLPFLTGKMTFKSGIYEFPMMFVQTEDGETSLGVHATDLCQLLQTDKSSAMVAAILLRGEYTLEVWTDPGLIVETSKAHLLCLFSDNKSLGHVHQVFWKEEKSPQIVIKSKIV